jgi:hypothetical protein
MNAGEWLFPPGLGVSRRGSPEVSVRWTRRRDVAAVEVYGVSTRLRYILWVIASCLIAGCAAKSETLLVYNWEALEGEIPPGPSSLPLFGSPRVAASPFGVDDVAGISLNGRAQVEAKAGYVDEGRDVRYELHYYDYQGRSWGRHGYYGGSRGGGGGHIRRVFRYSTQGSWSR